MRARVGVALLGQNTVIREGLGRILSDEHFDVRHSVDHHSLLTGDVAQDDLLILIDGDRDGSEPGVIHELHRRFPLVKMVLLSDEFDFGTMANAFRAGIFGYIVKEISCEPLIGSLRLVAMGEKVMPSRLVDELPFHVEVGERHVARQQLECARLSAREKEILSCLIVGHSNKVISRQLAISEATVKVHVKAILRKLRVKNRTQAAIQGVNGGLEFSPLDPAIDPGVAHFDIEALPVRNEPCATN